MKNRNIPGGTLILTMANALDQLVLGLFYIGVTQTNALTQTDIGTLSILSFLASTFSLITMLALPTALTKFTSEKLGKNKHEEAAAIQKIVAKTLLIISLAGFAVAIFSSQLISQYFWNNPEYIILLILNFIYALLSNITQLYRSTLQALYFFGKIAIINITFLLTSRVLAFILAMLQMGPTGVIIGLIFGSIITIIIAISFLRNQLPKTTKNMPLKPILYFSFPLFLTAITTLVLNWADIVIITSLTGDLSQTGIYSIVVSSVGTLVLLYRPMMTVIFPTLSSHHGLEKTKNIGKIIKTSSRIIIFIVLPACIGLALIAPTALTFFYGKSYAKGATILTILSTVTIITALTLLFETTLKAIGKTRQILKINIIAAVSSILALIALVPLLETTGAAIARVTTQAIIITLAVYFLKKEIKIQLDKEALWKSALSTTAFIPFLLAIEWTLSTRISTIQILALELLTAAAIYAFALYTLKALKNQDFQLLKQAFPKTITKYISIIERILVR